MGQTVLTKARVCLGYHAIGGVFRCSMLGSGSGLRSVVRVAGRATLVLCVGVRAEFGLGVCGVCWNYVTQTF